MFIWESIKNVFHKEALNINFNRKIPTVNPDIQIYQENDTPHILIDNADFPTDMDNIIEKDFLVTFENNRVKQIGNSIFAFARELVSAIAKNCELIKSRCFEGCYKLTTINFPKVKRIKDNGFLGCVKLEAIEFPELVSCGNSVFQYGADAKAEGLACNLKEVNLPKAHYLGLNSFSEQNKIETFNARELEAIGSGCFYKIGTENLELDLSKLKYIEGRIAGATLKKISLPSLEGFYDTVSYDVDSDVITPGTALTTVPYFPDITPNKCEYVDIGNVNLLSGCFPYLDYGQLQELHFNTSSVPLNVAFGGSWSGDDNIPTTLSKVYFKTLGNVPMFSGCRKIKELQIDNFSTNVASAFIGMTQLNKLNYDGEWNNIITDNELTFGDSTFSGCASLGNINIECKTKLKFLSAVINDCAVLTKIKFKIIDNENDLIFGSNNFRSCANLTDIYFDIGDTYTPEFGSNCFYGIEQTITIHVIGNVNQNDWTNAFSNYSKCELVFEN